MRAAPDRSVVDVQVFHPVFAADGLGSARMLGLAAVVDDEGVDELGWMRLRADASQRVFEAVVRAIPYPDDDRDIVWS